MQNISQIVSYIQEGERPSRCCTMILCLLNALVHKRHPFPPQKIWENSSSYLQNTGRFSKIFTTEILVETAKYCLPQIKYLIIHVFLINIRQGNVKCVLLKELASQNVSIVQQIVGLIPGLVKLRLYNWYFPSLCKAQSIQE